MKAKTVATVVLVAVLNAGTVFAQDGPILPDPPTQSYNFKLGLVGVFTMFAGALLMVPWNLEAGAENARLFGEEVCIINDPTTNTFDIYDGRCYASDPQIKAGLITLGIGGGLALVGFHRVKIAPQFGRKTVGAKLSVQW